MGDPDRVYVLRIFRQLLKAFEQERYKFEFAHFSGDPLEMEKLAEGMGEVFRQSKTNHYLRHLVWLSPASEGYKKYLYQQIAFYLVSGLGVEVLNLLGNLGNSDFRFFEKDGIYEYEYSALIRELNEFYSSPDMESLKITLASQLLAWLHNFESNYGKLTPELLEYKRSLERLSQD